MAPVKLALAVVVLLCAAATTATANRPYHHKPKPQPQPEPVQEDCKTQAKYFKNCLSLGYHEKCCGEAHVVADPKCFCEVEREAQIECAPGRHCSKIEGRVKIAELRLPCLKNLKCNHA